MFGLTARTFITRFSFDYIFVLNMSLTFVDTINKNKAYTILGQ